MRLCQVPVPPCALGQASAELDELLPVELLLGLLEELLLEETPLDEQLLDELSPDELLEEPSPEELLLDELAPEGLLLDELPLEELLSEELLLLEVLLTEEELEKLLDGPDEDEGADEDDQDVEEDEIGGGLELLDGEPLDEEPRPTPLDEENPVDDEPKLDDEGNHDELLNNVLLDAITASIVDVGQRSNQDSRKILRSRFSICNSRETDSTELTQDSLTPIERRLMPAEELLNVLWPGSA